MTIDRPPRYKTYLPAWEEMVAAEESRSVPPTSAQWQERSDRDRTISRRRKGLLVGVVSVALLVTLLAKFGGKDGAAKAEAAETSIGTGAAAAFASGMQNDLEVGTAIKVSNGAVEQVNSEQGPAGTVLESDGGEWNSEVYDTESSNQEEAPTINLELPAATLRAIEAQMPLINALEETYKEAAAEVGVPWQIVAALHYEEARNNPKCSIWAGEKLGTKNPDNHKIMPVTKKENYISGLKHFLAMAKSVYGINPEDLSGPVIELDKLGWATTSWFRGYKYLRGSMSYTICPYAMNGLAGHEHMRWPAKGGRLPNGNTYGETSSFAGEEASNVGFIAMATALGLRVK